MWFTMLWLNRCNRIVTCKERIERHALVQSYLDMFRSWQKNKNYNTQLRINKNAQILFFTAAMLELGIKGIHVTKKKKRKSCHAFCLPWEEAQPWDHTWCRGSGRQRTKRQLCSAILCFEAPKSSVKPQNGPKVRPDRAGPLTRRAEPLQSLCSVEKAEGRDDGKHAEVLVRGTEDTSVESTCPSETVKRSRALCVSCESTANKWRSLAITENEGKKETKTFHWGCSTMAAVRQWAAHAGNKWDTKKTKKKTTQRVVGTYGPEMCKIDTPHFRGVIGGGWGERLFSVCCGRALGRLWCSQSLRSSFNTTIKEKGKKKQLHGI